MRSIFLLLFLFLFSQVYSSENTSPTFIRLGKKWNIEGCMYYGKIIKHSKLYRQPITESSSAIELSITKQLSTEDLSYQQLKYPKVGMSFLAAGFGNNNVYGNALALFPHAAFTFKRTKKIDVSGRVGIGLAYLDKHYDEVSNPLNYTIGSTINNITQLNVLVDWKCPSGLVLSSGVGLTHFSNAHVQNPNLGINFIGLSLGLRGGLTQKEIIVTKLDSIPKKRKKNFYTAAFGVGFREAAESIRGPKYPVYQGYLQYARATSFANHIFMGVNYEYSTADHDVLRVTELASKSEIRKLSTSYSVYVGNEFFIKQLGLFVALGAVPPAFGKDFYYYEKLGVEYYMPSFSKKHPTQLFLGANLKAHMFSAELAELKTGLRF